MSLPFAKRAASVSRVRQRGLEQRTERQNP